MYTNLYLVVVINFETKKLALVEGLTQEVYVLLVISL